MSGRAAWFVAGAAAGLYASVRARRIVYRLTPAGVVDQAAALGVGLRAFGDELRSGMAAREAEILHRVTHDDPTSTLGREPRPLSLHERDDH